MAEFLVRIEFRDGDSAHDKLVEVEHKRVHELAAEGILRRLWMIPGSHAAWSIWETPDATGLHAAIKSLPFYPHIVVEVHALAAHPLDPARK
jgi:muconolactone D-isomerase